MDTIPELLTRARTTNGLGIAELEFLLRNKLVPVQRGALLACLLRTPADFTKFIEELVSNDPILSLLKIIIENSEPSSGAILDAQLISRWHRLLHLISNRQDIDYDLFRAITSDIVYRIAPDEFVGSFLMLTAIVGMSNDGVLALTRAMAASGKTYDYRFDSRLRRKKLFRRYPTGALSEKTALILPSLISALAQTYPVASPFLVARGLDYTGGTWDKLSSIPGSAASPHFRRK